jgi:hypothetical protein
MSESAHVAPVLLVRSIRPSVPSGNGDIIVFDSKLCTHLQQLHHTQQ